MSSTATGALTGQYVMNGYCKYKMNKKLRIILTRTVALVPCLLIVNFAQMSSANAILNTIQAIQLPFVLIPLARYIRNKSIMNELRFGSFKFGFILSTAVILIALNVYNVLQPFIDMGFDNWYVWTFMPVFSLYIGFLGYLIFLELDIRPFDVLNKKRIEERQCLQNNAPEVNKIANEATSGGDKKVGDMLNEPLIIGETLPEGRIAENKDNGIDVIETQSRNGQRNDERCTEQIFVFD